MAELLLWSEETPTAHGGVPDGLSDEVAALDPFAIWSRLESWTGHRWTPRGFAAVVEGPGDWVAPVAPVSDMEAHIWTDDQWQAVELVAAPLGVGLARDAIYRITGTAGADVVAGPDVLEAYRRLAEYIANLGTEPASISYSYNVGEITVNHRRERAAMTQAMQLSGAADMLRPYRRAK